MELGHLAILLDVARRGGFAPAARLNDLDPSTVSRIVAGIESELGARLFHRSTRTLTPTEAGARFLARAEAIVETMAAARDEARSASDALDGALRLTASVAFGQRMIAPLLPALRDAHPALRLELLFTDARLDLVADRVDLAVRLGPEMAGDLVAAKLRATRYRVVASPDYLRAAPLATPADLAGRSCLLLDLPAFRERWRFRDADGAALEIPVSGELVISSALALHDAAVAGLGPALLADWLIADALADGRLVDVFPAHAATATRFDTAAWIVYPARTFLPRKTRAAIDFFRARLGQGQRARP